MNRIDQVTILLATHNRCQLLLETLESIQAQSHKNWECIIVDDHSTDETFNVVKKLREEDSRFYYYLKEKRYKKGLPGTRNYAMDLADERNPHFIQFFDDDDLMHPEKLKLQLNELLRQPEKHVVLCGRRNFHEKNEIEYDEVQKYNKSSKLKLKEAFLIGNIRFGAQVPLFRYDYVKNFRFDEDLEYAEDWVLFSQLFFYDTPVFSVIEKVLLYRRKHPASMTEGGIENYNRVKALAIAGLKIFDFLSYNKLHTRVSLFYFTRRFLLYQFDSARVDEIKKIIGGCSSITALDRFRVKLAVLNHQVQRKIILRILNII